MDEFIFFKFNLDIKQEICTHLDLVTLLRFSEVCKDFLDLSSSERLWKRLVSSKYLVDHLSARILSHSQCHFHMDALKRRKLKMKVNNCDINRNLT